jgi:hypothetical protein
MLLGVLYKQFQRRCPSTPRKANDYSNKIKINKGHHLQVVSSFDSGITTLSHNRPFIQKTKAVI